MSENDSLDAEAFFKSVRDSNPELWKIIREKYPVLTHPRRDRKSREADTNFQEEEFESSNAPSVQRRAEREVYRQWMSEQWS